MTKEQIEQYAQAKADLAEALATIKAIDTYARMAAVGGWRHTVASMTSTVLRKHPK